MLNEEIEILHRKVRLFDLESLGINQNKVIRDLKPTFEELPFDEHDVRVLGYSQRPFRSRAITGFILTKTKDSWLIKQEEVKVFSQTVEDKRASPRRFKRISQNVSNNPEFEKLLLGVAHLINLQCPGFNRLKFIAHQVRIFATPESKGSNSPEGIHKDGYDFVVPALVINRQGITGGESQIYGPDKEKLLFSATLQPGQALLHEDKNGPLYHQVTPIETTAGIDYGVRDIFGFDIKLV